MSRDLRYFVYLMASDSGALYVGSTGDLMRRVHQHRTALPSCFTARYAVKKLVHFEHTPNSRSAVAREHEIKRWRREKKVKLIEAHNPGWVDLAAGWFPDSSGQDPSLRSG